MKVFEGESQSIIDTFDSKGHIEVILRLFEVIWGQLRNQYEESSGGKANFHPIPTAMNPKMTQQKLPQ